MFNAAKRYATVAIVDDAGEHTYVQLLQDARKVKSALGDRDHKGASIAMLVPNGYQYAAVQWGIWAAGGAVVPLSPMHPDRELEYFITNSEAKTLVCHPALLPNVQPVLDRLQGQISVVSTDVIHDLPNLPQADDLAVDDEQGALFIYTSGTTGKPKGVVLTHANIAAQITDLEEAWGWTPEDRLLHVLPLHHLHGIIVALCTALWSGATTEMLPKFDKDRVWNRIIDGPQDAAEEMPTERQRQAYTAMNSLRLTCSGSAALPTSVFRRWQKATGQIMLERYGMSEIGMALSNDGLNPQNRKAGSVGKPLPKVQVRLIDAEGKDVTETPGASGTIQIKGPNVFHAYYGLPEKTAKEFTSDGWFITGDVGTRDSDGLYYIMGRMSVDIIKSGGFKLSALEIERELLEHPNIVDVAVVGVPSEDWGEVVATAVTLKPDTTLTIEELKPWCYERISRYKTPKLLRIVDELPRNLMGKLDKKAVKAMFA
ncbi:AMP-dependent synthetase and ligase [Linderina pennispora]|uniref:AMP-dependent synthetase and ligase n=1 Tax=Linderina pennispora TaxID=61395 RepID=A0A1Y1W504_9FUNG|nr:AMP-dependent synthetase and ligase [Linderina pennispora]ORX68590.1 AMP-dependent synthetase and ligase [Linderina pennispora]